MLIYIDVYYTSFPSEPRLYTSVIYSVYVLETVYTFLVTYDLGQMFINPYSYSFSIPPHAILLCGGTGVLTFLQSETKAEILK